MAGKTTHQLALQPKARTGEGHPIDVVVGAKDSRGGVSGHVDLSGMPVPDRRFACDAVGVNVRDGFVQLLFGQSKPVGEGILSMLVINMGFESVIQFLDSIPPEFQRDYNQTGLKPKGSGITEFTTNADQTVVLPGSLVMAGYSGTNGCIDFYYASPFSMQQVAMIKKLSVEPIVRVNLPTSLLIAILVDLGSRVASFPKSVRE